MSSDDLYDGIHLNEFGIKFYVKCVKKVLNPLLGVKTELKTENESRKMRIWMTEISMIKEVIRNMFTQIIGMGSIVVLR